MGRYFVISVAILIAWAIVTVASMTYGAQYNWPDFVHVNYGLPLVFATHTLNTIAGPVDKWSVDLGQLAADLAFWSLGMVAIFLFSEYLRPSRHGKKSMPN